MEFHYQLDYFRTIHWEEKQDTWTVKHERTNVHSFILNKSRGEVGAIRAEVLRLPSIE